MFLQGLIGMIGGFLILVYRRQIKNVVGSIGFAEKIFGAGGTWTFLALLGVLIFILSLMWAMGTLQSVLTNVFGGILG